jgi:hypothetical protein
MTPGVAAGRSRLGRSWPRGPGRVVGPPVTALGVLARSFARPFSPSRVTGVIAFGDDPGGSPWTVSLPGRAVRSVRRRGQRPPPGCPGQHPYKRH